MTTRVSPPADSKHPTITVNGRVYNCSLGNTLDVPDHDAQIMGYNGWHIHALVYTTAGRPTGQLGAAGAPSKGQVIIDSTLNAAVIYDGTQWRNLLTGALV